MTNKTENKKNAAATEAAAPTTPVSALAAVIANRGKYTPGQKTAYGMDLLTAVVKDLKAGIDVNYVSSCGAYLDLNSAKGTENRVGKSEGGANSRRVIRAMVSQELAILMQTTVAERLARARGEGNKTLASLDKNLVVQVVQDGCTWFDSQVKKLAAQPVEGKAAELQDVIEFCRRWADKTANPAIFKSAAPADLKA